MTSSRAQPPPVNLKERIAALEQRNVSPGPRPMSPSGQFAPPPNSAGLRDKIAKFEKKGGVPVPRGSFGLGAPPLAENGPMKRRGELYGNRIPGTVRVSGGGPSVSRSGSPFDSTRSFSLSALEGENLNADYLASSPTSSPPPPFKPLTPHHTGTRDPLPRGTSFTTALELARKAEGNLEASLKPAGLEADTLEERSEGQGEEGKEALAHTSTSENEAVPLPSPPSIVLSPSGDLEEEQVSSDSTVSPEIVAMPETATPPALDTLESNAVLVAPVSPDESVSSKEEATVCPKATVIEKPVKATPAVVEPKSQPMSSSGDEVPAISQQVDSKQVEGLSPDSNGVAAEPSPLSPMGPFTLANAVHDLGQVVANIHEMFPGQISPLADPPPFRPLRLDTSVQEKSQAPKTPLRSKKSVPDLHIPPNTADVVPVPSLRRDPSLAPSASAGSNLATPRSTNGRPVSMIETSPSHVVVAHRVTPLTSRGVPVFLAGKEQKNIEHFPPTPEPDTSEFGTVSMHKPSHSFSHARTYVPHNPSETPSFSAVVHAKVTETAPAPAPSASYKDFYAKVPETPQVNRTPAETPMSPGYGELATLLHEAALLELTLEQGELPTEAMRQEESERKQREEQEQKEREKEAAARAKVEEERRKHAAVAKARAKQEATESKSKSSFRNPLLRSKNSHKRGVSTDSQASRASNEPVRHKSVVQQASSIDSIPETVDVDARTSSQTSPKSPSRYFTSLRRLASTSRPSTSISQYSRNSVSASSEISSEDSASIPTPPGNGMYSAGSHANGSTAGSERSSIFGGNGIAWPSLSPKKSPNMGRAASFADKMFNRGRTKSTVSTNSPYDAVDRLTKSRAAKSAAALIPPLDPISFTLDVPVVDDKDLPSPRRSASLYVPSLSSFPPTYATKPTSPVYTSQVTASLDSMLSERLTSPVYNPQQAPSHGMQSLDTLFSAKPTSPVYTPHIPAMKSEETITDSLMPSPNPSSLLPSPQHHNSNRSSWISGVSDLSMDSSTSSIPSPFFDSFPSVPEDTPLPPALPGRRRNFHRPSLPLPAPSFFEPAPLSSAAVGSEFSPAPSAFTRSATLPRISGEHRR